MPFCDKLICAHVGVWCLLGLLGLYRANYYPVLETILYCDIYLKEDTLYDAQKYVVNYVYLQLMTSIITSSVSVYSARVTSSVMEGFNWVSTKWVGKMG